MLGIKDAIKKLYTGEEIIIKHIMLFVLAGVPVMLSNPLNEISKRVGLSATDVFMSLLALIVMAVISIYLGGYIYGIIHNSFDETKQGILPDFDKSWFKIFFQALPVQIVWILYIILVFILAFICKILLAIVIGPKAAAMTIFTLFTIFAAIVFMMIPFIFTEFSKEYKRDGLYNFMLIFTYLRKTFKSVLWLMVKLLPIFIIVAIVNIFGRGNDVVSYICTALGAYLTTIMQYIASYCYVQIYKEKLSGQNLL